MNPPSRPFTPDTTLPIDLRNSLVVKKCIRDCTRVSIIDTLDYRVGDSLLLYRNEGALILVGIIEFIELYKDNLGC